MKTVTDSVVAVVTVLVNNLPSIITSIAGAIVVVRKTHKRVIKETDKQTEVLTNEIRGKSTTDEISIVVAPSIEPNVHNTRERHHGKV